MLIEREETNSFFGVVKGMILRLSGHCGLKACEGGVGLVKCLLKKT